MPADLVGTFFDSFDERSIRCLPDSGILVSTVQLCVVIRHDAPKKLEIIAEQRAEKRLYFAGKFQSTCTIQLLPRWLCFPGAFQKGTLCFILKVECPLSNPPLMIEGRKNLTMTAGQRVLRAIYLLLRGFQTPQMPPNPADSRSDYCRAK